MKESSLASKTARASVLLILGQFWKLCLQIGSLAILARMLTPDDFGLIAMVTVIISFLNLISGLGLVQATIQRKDITPAEISQLFWFNFFISLLLGLGLVLAAPFVAEFYGREELVSVVRVLALLVFIHGASMQHNALLQRDFQFRKIVIVESIASVLSVLVAILMAYFGYQYWALVGQVFVLSSLTATGYVLSSRWLPSPPNFKVGITPYLKYGVGLAASNLSNFTTRNIDTVVIGKFYTSGELALYQKAYSLLMLPIYQINVPLGKVLLPALSRRQDEPDVYRLAYKKAIGCLSSVSIPTAVFLGVVSLELIQLVLGSQWVESNQYFLALLPAAVVGATNMGTGWVYLSVGHTGRQFQWGLFNTGVFAVGILIASQHSVLAICITISALFTLLRPPGVAFCFRDTPLKVLDFFYPVLRQLLVALVAASMVVLVVSYMPDAKSDLFGLIVSIATKSVFYTVFLVTLDLLLPGAGISDHAAYIYKLLLRK